MSNFTFELRPGEDIPARIVRCCHEALDAGPMGESARHDDYKAFIGGGQEVDDAAAEALTHVRTSCAMFVRAVHLWCGLAPTGPYVPGTPMFVSMGVPHGFSEPGFVSISSGTPPSPGWCFYMAPDATSNAGHTGLFLADQGNGLWDTAEGGGGDGTLCRLKQRTIAGDHFADDAARQVFGWFDCTQIGLPASPVDTGTPAGDDTGMSTFGKVLLVALGMLGTAGAAAGAHYYATGTWPGTPAASIFYALLGAEKRTGLGGLATGARARALALRGPVEEVLAYLARAPASALAELGG